MSDVEAREGAKDEPSRTMSSEDRKEVDERGSGSAKVVHEVVRIQGEEELNRSLRSLALSGFAAGLAISASILTQAFLKMRLPDAPWRELVVALGYATGFIVVILGRLQLFTETTVTAVLPLATDLTLRNLGRLLRLWTVVLFANLAGTFVVALLVRHEIIVTQEQYAATLDLSRKLLEQDFNTTLLMGAPAGFLIASIAWMLPNARGSEFWVILIVTYVIGIGGYSHVVAGSGEAWLLMLSGETGLAGAVGGIMLPTLIGNILGGTGLFAVLAHGQVRDEIKAGD